MYSPSSHICCGIDLLVPESAVGVRGCDVELLAQVVGRALVARIVSRVGEREEHPTFVDLVEVEIVLRGSS